MSGTEIISRKEAIDRGLKHYFTGEPCWRGHISTRHLCRSCVRCHSELTAKRNKEKYASNPDPRRQKSRIYRAKNIEIERRKSREYHRKIADLIAVLRAEQPELLKEFGL